MSPFAPEPLPPSLQRSPFTVATGRAAGTSRDRLRAADLERRVYGVRAAEGSADDLRSRCRMFAARLPPGTFVSHSTAALLLGLPIPHRFERLKRIHVTIEAPARAPHADGLIGHSRRVSRGDVVVDPDGIRRSSVERVICEMSGVLAVDDLVALIDRAIHFRSPMTDVAAIAARWEVGDRIARSRRPPTALALANPRSESRPESRLRVLVHRSGMPDWVPNLEVRTSGGYSYRLDLALAHRKRALEYQGDYHLSAEQRRHDMTRRAELEADGWRILEVNADDLADPDSLIDRILRFMASG